MVLTEVELFHVAQVYEQQDGHGHAVKDPQGVSNLGWLHSGEYNRRKEYSCSIMPKAFWGESAPYVFLIKVCLMSSVVVVVLRCCCSPGSRVDSPGFP